MYPSSLLLLWTYMKLQYTRPTWLLAFERRRSKSKNNITAGIYTITPNRSRKVPRRAVSSQSSISIFLHNSCVTDLLKLIPWDDLRWSRSHMRPSIDALANDQSPSSWARCTAADDGRQSALLVGNSNRSSFPYV